ncbi:YndM family protein [Metabacillus litoralis]|uniref:YndM family protein n=1 Tax=Metabacillus litoralis TaxID=152268 RepID=UPI001CFC528B|nr:YndM family protein [Metabacillus litoralis]
MKHSTLLLIKFITCVIAFGLGLDLFFEATIVDILSFSLFVTVTSYIVGELIILPQLGKRAAAVVDFLLTYLSVWVFGSILFESYLQIAWGSIISALLITAAEIFIHLLVEERGPAAKYFENRGSIVKPTLVYGTEFAEDENVSDLAKKVQKKLEDE